MRITSVLPFALLCAACTEESKPPDIVGPFTGPVQRFVVDQIKLPASSSEAAALADDLDGNGLSENEAGSLIGALASQGDTTIHAADMIAAGTIASVFEIEADDLANDATVGVRYLGTPTADSSEL